MVSAVYVNNFNEMQMIFSAISGSSGQVPVTSIDCIIILLAVRQAAQFMKNCGHLGGNKF